MKFIQQRVGAWTVFVYECDPSKVSGWCGYVRSEAYPTDPDLPFVTYQNSLSNAAGACLRFLQEQTEDLKTLHSRVRQLLEPEAAHENAKQIPLDLG